MSTRFSKKEIQKGRKMRTTSDRVEPFPPNCAAPRCFHSLFLFAQPSRADRRQWSFIRAGEREVAVGFYCATSASTPRGRRRLYFHHNSSYQLHGRVVLLLLLLLLYLQWCFLHYLTQTLSVHPRISTIHRLDCSFLSGVKCRRGYREPAENKYIYLRSRSEHFTKYVCEFKINITHYCTLKY